MYFQLMISDLPRCFFAWVVELASTRGQSIKRVQHWPRRLT